MRCKPGDLCVILSPTDGSYCPFTGALAEVIEPLRDRQIYPDLGNVIHLHRAHIGEWLCRFIGTEKEHFDGGSTSYGRMWDHRLRPIPGGETPEESTEAMRRLHDTTVKQGEPA